MNSLTDDEIVCRFAYMPYRPPGYKVKISKWPRLPANLPALIPQEGKSVLCRLPAEILSAVALHLDIESLMQFALTSRCNAHIALSTPEYVALVRHAPTALGGLSELGLLGLHTVAALHRILTSDKCVLCGRFGSFFFALKGERCCWMCAAYDTRLWAVPLRDVMQEYRLTESQLRMFPTTLDDRQGPLISARAAVSAALQQRNGSEAAIRRDLHLPPRERKPMSKKDDAYAERLSEWQIYGDRSLQHISYILDLAIRQQDAHQSSLMHSRAAYYIRRYHPAWRNAPYVRFPHLRPKQHGASSDAGFWCPGCRLAAFGTVGDDPIMVRRAREGYLREMSRTDFVKHARSCGKLQTALLENGEDKFRKVMACGGRQTVCCQSSN
ncbi:hypothetical protein LEL_06185 [Akanthomyces lecanii RCEF 1005]|uniref:F-box domain-containing protein n=1 Tax=Akanthomyces lecanii RCEF 1005 TaxID=1081108 RepID=A0A168GHR6_CORDF|nr:hypothetical protein LEL_06185 [Akanthomyces lecanii RCEF 1005]